MTQTNTLIRLPTGSTGCGNIRLVSNGVILLVKYQYFDGGDCLGGLLFDKVSAFRFAGEYYGDHLEDTYDCVLEILDSKWLAELRLLEDVNPFSSVKGQHHYSVFLSSNGYLDVIAAGVREVQTEECDELAWN